MERKGWNLLWLLAGVGGAVFVAACLLVAGAFALLLVFGEASAGPGTSSGAGPLASTPAPRRSSLPSPLPGTSPSASPVPSRDALVDEGAFWASLPRPPDETPLPVTEGVDMAYGTALPPDQVLDMYAAWLAERGWQPVPPEAVPGVHLPTQEATVQVWRKGDAFFAVVARRQEDARGTRVELLLRRE